MNGLKRLTDSLINLAGRLWDKPLLFAAVFFALGVVSTLSPAAVKAGGMETCELGTSTGTAIVRCLNGAGTLFAIEIDTAAAAGFIVCYDSASTSGWTAAPGTNGVDDGKAVGPNVVAPKVGWVTAPATNTGYSLAAVGLGMGRDLDNGLVCIKSAAGISGRALYLAE